MKLTNEQQSAVLNLFSELYGHKKVQIISYLILHADEKHIYKGTLKEISETLDVSKPTIISLFNQLKRLHLLYKEKNGYYRLNEKIFTKEAK